ncbi:HAMP domain-containing sensor histidine kinase [Catellatospora citrea]|uniref:sensor histidine kinase n=1 Tax=Catellatospora citrea TaxID=53366 RepID=UPI0033E9C068
MAFLVPLALAVRNSASTRAVTSAVVQAQALSGVLSTATPARLDVLLADANAATDGRLTLFLSDGTVLGYPAPRSAAVEAALGGSSLTARVPEGREVLVSVAGLPSGPAAVRCLVPDATWTGGVYRAWLLLCLLGLGLLAVSLLVAGRLAGTLTRPISELAGVSHRLAAGDLSARAGEAGPAEVRQVSAGLNLLASRIGELLADEREAVADLSHRLRTPLTALRIDAESLRDDRERHQIMADLDAVERTVNEVIRAARRPIREGVGASCDAAAVVAERVIFWSALAEEENRVVLRRLPAGPLPVRVTADDLGACVDALLDNVFAHTPEGRGFEVRLQALPDGGGVLVVNDAGPGLTASSWRRGGSGAGSTGLGLDIVRRTAENSGGAVWFGTAPGGGASIMVEFGPASTRQPVAHPIGRRLLPR